MENRNEIKLVLKRYGELIDDEIKKLFDGCVSDVFGFTDKQRNFSSELLEKAREYCLRGGKRARGSLVFIGYKLAGGEDEKKVVGVATAIQLIHAALLAHDDFMDQDALRRGGETFNAHYMGLARKALGNPAAKHYGDSMAVDVGDVILMLGFELLSRSEGCLGVTTLVSRRIMETALGQAFDVSMGLFESIDENDVLALHQSKTGMYTLSLPLEMGLTMAGAGEKKMEMIRKLAIPLGIAFQLRDDELGMYGNEEETGKSSDSDIRQGKNTLLMVKSLEMANSGDKGLLKQYWGNGDITSEQADEVRRIVRESGSLEYSRRRVRDLAEAVYGILKGMSASEWNTDQIVVMKQMADYLVGRES